VKNGVNVLGIAMNSLSADEFVANIAGLESLPISTQTDLLAYYLVSYSGAKEVTAATLASLREALHLSAHSRLPQYLSEQTKRRGTKSGRYVKTKNGYVLERSYSRSLQIAHLGRPAARNVSVSLRGTLIAIGDPAVKSYLEEAISCFEQNLLRSAVIMTWCVSYGLFRAWLYRNHLVGLNAALGTWKTPVKLSKLDDFQELTESNVIDTARKIGAITKEQQKTLKQLLDQRNSYAHPTTMVITPSIAEASIEIVIREVLPVFG
jgi:hypothetical protein